MVRLFTHQPDGSTGPWVAMAYIYPVCFIFSSLFEYVRVDEAYTEWIMAEIEDFDYKFTRGA
jgi:hypothetical protein